VDLTRAYANSDPRMTVSVSSRLWMNVTDLTGFVRAETGEMVLQLAKIASRFFLLLNFCDEQLSAQRVRSVGDSAATN
jgi:hypothetical protein